MAVAGPRRFPARLRDTLAILGRETIASGDGIATRLRRLGALLLAGLTQIFDRGRVLIFLLPVTFDRSLTWSVERGLDGYGTAAAAGIAVAAVFFGWGLLVGFSFHWSLDEYPATTRAFLANHPAVVGVISSAIDGFPRSPTEYRALGVSAGVGDSGHEFGPYATRRTAFGKAVLAVSRGLKTAFVFGTTAHVGMAKVGGFSQRAIRRRTMVVTTEAALVLGAVAVLVSGLLTHDLFGAAERMRHTITDRRLLLSATVLLIVAASLDNAGRRRRFVEENDELDPTRRWCDRLRPSR